jgi:hypothetical protein
MMPTSVLFGFWDSRGDQTKHARVLLARIDAFNVVPCRRHALYSGPYSKDEFSEIVLGDVTRAKKKEDADKMAEQGFSSAPSDGLGGVVVEDRIERLSLLSLTDLARIVCNGEDGLTNAARRYLFALAGLAEGYTRSTGSHRLRSGCELVAADKSSLEIKLRGGAGDYPEAEALKELYQNRDLLIAVATEAKDKLGIPSKLSDFVVSRETLKGDFVATAVPAVQAPATDGADKQTKAGRKK